MEQESIISPSSGGQETDDLRLRVLTFNLWGIFNSKIRVERFRRFAEKVEHYDVILLQELFLDEDLRFIMDQLPPAVRASRYCKRFPSSFYGSGCAVISRYPIEFALFHVFPLQGYPEMILHGDFFANKGVALIKILVPLPGSATPVTVRLYTTHLVAVYTKISRLHDWRSERYLPYRISQAISLAEYISATAAPGDPLIIGGDFNSSPGSLEVQIMRILLKQRGFQLQPALPSPLPIPPTPQFSLRTVAPTGLASDPSIDWQSENVPNSLARSHAYYTYADSNPFNTMSTSYFKLLHLQGDIPVQIDHIFYDTENFVMEPFEDCPDYEAPVLRPSRAGGESNALPTSTSTTSPLHPSAVVVLTKAEIPWSSEARHPGFLSTIKDWVAWTSRGALFPSRYRRQLPYSIEAMEHYDAMFSGASPTGGEVSVSGAPTMFPLSDHYGVATRLRLTSKHAANGRPPRRPTPKPILTEEERQVIENVREVLMLTAQRLRRQSFYSRVFAATCTACAAISLLKLHHDRRCHERVKAMSLMIISKAIERIDRAEQRSASHQGSVADSLQKAAVWAGKNAQCVGAAAVGAAKSGFHWACGLKQQWMDGAPHASPPSSLPKHAVSAGKGPAAATAAVLPAEVNSPPAACAPIKDLQLNDLIVHLRGPSNFLYLFMLAIGPFFAASAAGVGVFHRFGNAQLFEDQIRTIEVVCYPPI